MEYISLDRLIQYCTENERVCPNPNSWNLLWKKLKNKKQVETGGWDPSAPLILSAWWHSSSNQKKKRFHEHLKWADKQNQIEEISTFVMELKEGDWFHEND